MSFIAISAPGMDTIQVIVPDGPVTVERLYHYPPGAPDAPEFVNGSPSDPGRVPFAELAFDVPDVIPFTMSAGFVKGPSNPVKRARGVIQVMMVNAVKRHVSPGVSDEQIIQAINTALDAEPRPILDWLSKVNWEKLLEIILTLLKLAA